MTRGKTTVILLILGCVLTLWWAFFERSRFGSEVFAGRVFFSLMREDIERIEIQRPGETVVLLRGAEDRWSLKYPLEYPAKKGPVDVMLGSIVFLSAKVPLEGKAEGSFPAKDRRTVLRFQAQGREYVVEIGNEHVEKPLAYYRVGDKEFLGGERLKINCDRPVDEWRDDAVCPILPEKVGRLEITSREHRIVTERTEGGYWLIKEPFKGRGDTAVVQGLLDGLNALSAEKFFRDEGERSLSEFGLEEPRWTVAVEARQSDKRFEISVGSEVGPEEEPDIYVKRADGPQVFRCRVVLSGALKLKPGEFRDRHVLPFSGYDAVKKISVRGREADYYLRRESKEGRWTLVNRNTKKEVRTTDKRARALVDSCKTLLVTEYMGEKPIGAERMRITVDLLEKTEPMVLIFGKEVQEGSFLALRRGVEGAKEETVLIKTQLPGRLEHSVYWQPLKRAEIPREKLLAFRIRSEKGSWLLLQFDKWEVDRDRTVEIDQDIVKKAVEMVCQPTAMYFEPQPPPLPELGLIRVRSRLRVTIPRDLGDFPYHELLVGDRVDPPKPVSYAKLDSDPAVFMLDPAPLFELADHLAGKFGD